MNAYSISFRTLSPLLLILAVLLASTRNHHFASYTHLPDASWAVFFLAGFYLGRARDLILLLAMAIISDYVAISGFGISDACVSPAYIFLLPAYGALWMAGTLYARCYRFEPETLLPLAGLAFLGTAACELLSSGGFYFFSGRFAETSLTGFGDRWLNYFPQSLEGLAFYLCFAAIAHVALTLGRERNGLIPPHTHTH